MNEREKKICAKYSARDKKGFVHCFECPLRINQYGDYDFRCKANCYYDRHTKEWEYKELKEVKGGIV